MPVSHHHKRPSDVAGRPFDSVIVFHRWSIDTEAVCAGAIVSDWIESDEVSGQQYSAVLENFAVTRPGARGRRIESCQCSVSVTGQGV